jgi:DNA-binding MarR family transcriptional regulator
MLALWEREARSVSELAELLALDPGTLSPLLRRLETSGLVDRRRDPADERVLQVTLTDAGRALWARAAQVPAAIVERLGVDVSELAERHVILTR